MARSSLSDFWAVYSAKAVGSHDSETLDQISLIRSLREPLMMEVGWFIA